MMTTLCPLSTERLGKPAKLQWTVILLTFATLTVSVRSVSSVQAQDRNIRARIDRATATSFHVQAGRDQGLDEHDVVDAFSDTAYVGSLQVVEVSERAAELAFLRDDVVGQQRRRPHLTPGDYLYLRFASDDNYGRTPGRVRMPRNLSVDVRFASVYDSNIDHNDESAESYGLVPAARMRLRSSVDDPLLTAVYVVARHDYSNTDRWTRTSHLANLIFEPRTSDWFRMSTVGQVSIRGSSEDRDISNQYRVEQDLEVRFSRRHRLIVYGGLVWKKFPDSPVDDAFKPRVGGEYRRYGSGGRRWELDVRREWNEEQEIEGEYDRWKFETSYRFPIGRVALARIELEYRRKTYRERFVEIEDDDFLRRDYRWTVGTSATREIGRNLSVELGYRFEKRDSNDPDKLYSAHMVTLGLGYSLFGGQ
jgi:hypothetical protein